ncbi:MAG: amino acid ABC transporter permease [Treponema sp.]|nr:amino acid ABC transporter permease [Treponema sp.]
MMKKAKPSIFNYLYEEPGPNTKRLTAIATVISGCLLAALFFAITLRFYTTGQFARQHWYFFARFTTWKFVLSGIWGTVQAAFVAGILAFILGFCMMAGRICKYTVVRFICTAFIEFTRGVPTLLLIYFFFLALPAMGIQMQALLKISYPVAISASGIVAEILRTGVLAVPRGQTEAAASLGLTEWHVFTKIIFPQGFRYVIPSLISEIVIVVKDTTFAYIVSFPDLMQNAKVLISNYDAMLSVYVLVAILYITINYVLNTLSEKLAQRRTISWQKS